MRNQAAGAYRVGPPSWLRSAIARSNFNATGGHTFALGATESPAQRLSPTRVAANPQKNRTDPDGRKKVSPLARRIPVV